MIPRGDKWHQGIPHDHFRKIAHHFDADGNYKIHDPAVAAIAEVARVVGAKMSVGFGTPATPVSHSSAVTSYTLSLSGVTSGQPCLVLQTCPGGATGKSSTISGISDNFSTPYSWTQVISATGGQSETLCIWIGTGGAGTSGTITVSCTSGTPSACAVSCTGASTASGLSAVDTSNYTTSSGSTSAFLPSITPSASGEGAFAAISINGDAGQTITAGLGSPWSETAVPWAFGGASGYMSLYANPPTSNLDTYDYTVNTGGGTGWVTAAVVMRIEFSAPSAPTLTSPTNASYQDVASGLAFSGTYNSTDAYYQNAYAFRIKVSSGSYNYWNAGTSALQGTIVWNAISTSPGGSFGLTLPNTAISDGNAYNWSMASQEAGASLQGPFATDFTFTAQAAPTVIVNEPTGAIGGTLQPAVTWTTTPPAGASQTAYHVIVESGSYSTTPGSGTQAWTSGVVSSAAMVTFVGNSGTPPGATLQSGVTYRFFVQITETGGQTSAWGYSTATCVVDVPAMPTITAAEITDPETGCPAIQLTVQGLDNMVSAADSSFETGTGDWAGYNCSLAQSTDYALDGTHSMKVTCGNSGPYAPYTPAGVSGIPIIPGQIYTALAFLRSGGLQLSAYLNVALCNSSGGGSGGGGNGPTVQVLPTSWTPIVLTFTAGAGSVFAQIAPQIAGGQPSVLYVDCVGLFPGTFDPFDDLLASLSPSAYWKLNDDYLGASWDAVMTLLAANAWWKMGEASGNFADSSGNGHTATAHGSWTYQQAGPLARAATEYAALGDGSSAYAQAASYQPGGTTLSAVAWYKTSTSGLGIILDSGAGGSTGGIDLYINNGTLIGAVASSAGNVGADDSITTNDGAWHLAVAAWDGAHIRLYRDGVLVATSAIAGTVTSGAYLTIAAATNATDFFKGDLAQVAVFTSALSLAQIEGLYLAGPLVAADSSGNGYTGLLNGTVTESQTGPVVNYSSDSAMLFNGSSGYVVTTYKPGASATLSLIAAYKTTGNTEWLCDNGPSQGSDGVSFYINGSGQLVGYVHADGVTDPTPTNDGNWHIAVLTYDGADIRVYRDGVLVNVPLAHTGNVTAAGNFKIAATYTGTPHYFGGTVAQVGVIIGTVLSQAQATALYNALSAQGWSLGGYSGSTFVQILRSDNCFVRWASSANPLALGATVSPPGYWVTNDPALQLATVNDYEVIPGNDYSYQATVIIQTPSLASAPATSGTVDYLPNPPRWWSLNPLNPATASNAQFVGWTPMQIEQSGSNQVLNVPVANVVANAMMNQEFSANAETFTDAIYNSFQALLTGQQTCFVSSPWGAIDSGYFRFALSSTSGGGGSGSTAKNVTLHPSVIGSGHRSTAVLALAQFRPQV